MDYKKVKGKYVDSLSRYDLHEELTNPKKFGPHDFGEIEALLTQMVGLIYELEVLDFRDNSNLYPKEIREIESARNALNDQFKKILEFKLEGNPEAEKTRIVHDIRQMNEGSQFYNIDNTLTKLRLKGLLNNPKGKELNALVEAGKAQLQEVLLAKDEIEDIKEDFKNIVDEAKKSTAEAGVYKSQVGTLQIAKFFTDQAVEHRVGALGSGKKWRYVFDGWLRKRSVFFFLIAIFTLGNILAYFVDISDSELNIFNLEYGILSLSLLLILYVGLAFATSNYSVEKQLEIENKNKANIANTLELFLAGMQSEDTSRSIVLQEASKTLFAKPQVGFKKIAMHDASTPLTEITKVVQEVSSSKIKSE